MVLPFVDLPNGADIQVESSPMQVGFFHRTAHLVTLQQYSSLQGIKATRLKKETGGGAVEKDSDLPQTKIEPGQVDEWCTTPRHTSTEAETPNKQITQLGIKIFELWGKPEVPHL